MATVKIFRINYKSDFILTLNSDAGWMTPFCIKFWTGAPSQAYFVSFDGETYNHCAPVAGEPTKLQVQFDDHHLPIGDLKFQIGYHFTVADFPNDTEDEVLNQASVIIEQDGEPAKVMLDFNGETAPEIEFSLPAYANEAQRIANEEARIEAEQQRVEAEQTRQLNEQTRVNQETARVNEYAELKADAVVATRDANDAATLATQKAGMANDAAELATQKAGLANDAAELATQKAGLANDAAALAAQKAGLADDAATLANQKAQYAKEQGDYAKEQGDYAKAQTGLIPVDVTRTQTDATFVNGDNDPLFYLRQATSSLAGLMAAAEHTKLNDMPSAQEANVGLIYDVSALHPTSGVNGGSTYASLSAALAVIPQGKQKGGMSVKFVQSSDNKYVQFFCMAQNFTTDVTKWQGVDNELKTGSDNLITGGAISRLVKDDFTNDFSLGDEQGNIVLALKGGEIETKKFKSEQTPKTNSVLNYPLSIGDDNGNIIVIFEDGHIKTKNFDSKNINVEQKATWTAPYYERQVFAHRGDSTHCPEDTMPAFISAFNKGCKAMEADIKRNADGELFILHDRTVDRTSNGTGNIADLTTQQLLALDFGYPALYGNEFAGTKIPTLREFLIFCNYNNIIANLDCRANDAFDVEWTAQMMSIVKETGMEDRVVYTPREAVMDAIYAIKKDVRYIVDWDNYVLYNNKYPLAIPIVNIRYAWGVTEQKIINIHNIGGKALCYLKDNDTVAKGKEVFALGIDYLFSEYTYGQDYGSTF